MRSPRAIGPTWVRFCHNLRHAMARAGRTEAQVAKAMGRSTRWVRRILAGDTAPHIDDLRGLAKAVRVPPEQLLFGEVEPPPPQKICPSSTSSASGTDTWSSP